MFIKLEAVTGQKVDHCWRYGRVVETKKEKKDLRVHIEYANGDSKRTKKEQTDRSYRDVIIIFRLDEIPLNTADYQLAMQIQEKYEGKLHSTKYLSQSLLDHEAAKNNLGLDAGDEEVPTDEDE